MNDDKWIPHVNKEGSRRHVLYYDTYGVYCSEKNCEINKPKYEKPEWSIKQVIRETGLVEDICKHGVGHPNAQWLKEHDPHGKNCFGVHGCDGCCTEGIDKLDDTKAYVSHETICNTDESTKTQKLNRRQALKNIISYCNDMINRDHIIYLKEVEDIIKYLKESDYNVYYKFWVKEDKR